MASPRLPVLRTPKLLLGGKFVRSEGGHVLPAVSPKGAVLANVPRATRKDLRDAVTAARGAAHSWGSVTAYMRGQILYRAAEMLEHRASEMVEEITASTGATPAAARREVAACCDRLVYFAGWTDKLSQVFGSVNPVASPHFNFTLPEPTGVVAIFSPDSPSLLPAVSLLAPVLAGGNTAILVASDKHPLPVLTLGEILATSDIPAGVVNLLTGKRSEVSDTAAKHLDLNAIVDGTGDPALGAALQAGTALNLKRYSAHTAPKGDWTSPACDNPRWILDTVEFKTAWHPIGV